MRMLLSATAVLVAATIHAQDLPQPSPKGQVEQIVGLTKVEVDYSRPSAKGRVIFGDLVPYDKLWRTGANLNTTIEFSGPVKFGDVDVKAGKYSLFTVPGKDVWVVHLNSNTELWGEDDYKAEQNVATVKVKAQGADMTETLTIDIANVVNDAADLEIRWEKTRVLVPIHADATEQALANIREAMAKGDMKAGGYGGSARFCLDRNVMTKEALGWAQKSVEMDKKFWHMHTLARAQAANGMTKEAIATANESMSMAQEAKNEAYVKMNRELIESLSKGK
ncbi:MAG: DUF2911 domain-containing protein [Flavobacteriales bacterium]|nr:DUF2911 domain-containing protein [Flavobacteriales bacterium]HPF89124.1 DUF2911 domain-containing protein [Flavobacteriales bacterium]